MGKKTSNRDSGIKAIFTLVYPLGSFLYSLKDIKSRSTHWVFLAFFILYGLSFTIGFEGADSYRYVQDFYSFTTDAEDNFSETIKEYFSKDSQIKDIFEYVLFYITYLLAGNNYHILFGIVATIFGYFYIRSLQQLTKDELFRNNSFFFVLFLIFSFSNPMFNINGVRFWTATWIATYATFQILVCKNRRYILLMLFLPMIHGAYYVYLVFFLIAYFVRHFYKVLPYLFFISFFFTDVALKIIPDYTDFLPPFMQTMVWNYTESETAMARMSMDGTVQEALYARILMSLPKYYHIILIFLLVRSQKFFRDESSKEFLGFLLGLGTLNNFCLMIPSMGRFWQILIPFYVYLWVHNSHVMIRYKQWIYIYPIIALYPAFRVLRIMFYTTDPFLFISNAIHIIYNALV